MKEILITGIGMAKNKGDAAFTRVLLDYLRSKDGLNVCLCPCISKKEKPYEGLEIVPSSRKNVIRSLMLIITTIMSRIFPKLTIKNKELLCFKRADVIIDLSGDMLTEDYGVPILISHYMPLIVAVILKKKFYICAQGLGPYRFTELVTRYILNKASLITIREPISYHYVKNVLKLKNKNIHMTADLAFLLTPERGEGIDAFCQKNKLDKGSFVGIVPAGLFLNKNKKYLENTLKALSKTIDYIISKYNKKVVLIAHSTGPQKRHDDRIIAKEIWDMVKNKNSVYLLENDLEAAELKYLIKHTHFLMSMRMHANIAALSTGVPAVGLSYGVKFKGIFSLFDLKNMVIELKDVSFQTLQEKIDFCFSSNETIRQQISAGAKHIQELAEKNFLLFEKYFLNDLS